MASRTHPHHPPMRDRLTDIYDRLLERYGPRDWWPADSRFEVMVGAVLVQNTAWSNAEKAIGALSDAGLLSPHGLRSADVADIAQLIYSSGYYNMKARKLKALVEWLGERDDDIEALMADDPAALSARSSSPSTASVRRPPTTSCSTPSTCRSSSSTTTPSASSSVSVSRQRKGRTPSTSNSSPSSLPVKRPALQRVPRPDRHPRRERLQEGAGL